MAVALNDSGTRSASSITTTSVDLTTLTVSAGSNLGLIVFTFHKFTSAFVTSVTAAWDNAGTPQAMTSAGIANGTGVHARTQAWYLANPTPGNKTLHIEWTGNSTAIVVAMGLSGVSQTTPVVLADTVTDAQTTSAPSLIVTSGANDLTAAAFCETDQTINSTDTQTELVLLNGLSGADVGVAESYGLGGSSNTHTWTMAAPAEWAGVGVHVLAASSKFILIPGR